MSQTAYRTLVSTHIAQVISINSVCQWFTKTEYSAKPIFGLQRQPPLKTPAFPEGRPQATDLLKWACKPIFTITNCTCTVGNSSDKDSPLVAEPVKLKASALFPKTSLVICTPIATLLTVTLCDRIVLVQVQNDSFAGFHQLTRELQGLYFTRLCQPLTNARSKGTVKRITLPFNTTTHRSVAFSTARTLKDNKYLEIKFKEKLKNLEWTALQMLFSKSRSDCSVERYGIKATQQTNSVSCQHLDWTGFVSEESKESPRRFRTEQDRCQSGRTAYSYSSTVHQGTVPLHMQKPLLHEVDPVNLLDGFHIKCQFVESKMFHWEHHISDKLSPNLRLSFPQTHTGFNNMQEDKPCACRIYSYGAPSQVKHEYQCSGLNGHAKASRLLDRKL
ncbi:hypothetical protein Anapl_00825 [Anas platyrhynchos]|uniref:Uncharacterized protein n=1 Tax=Anas platyrhynchos TaxID=8839 RepID=R0K995_ANAPL|nr:hypothetical protein Anapl_00825 [Anas platyrhynchos]